MGLTEAEAVGKMWSGVKAMIQVIATSFHNDTGVKEMIQVSTS